ncbi:SPOR domain-containing protein [Thalassomonas viridans]|uniref:SPOR domain-containing protein n=1 Tax=Thalassomonas viridans TaxID=137584 RepID=A0AAE9Z368_9GAMM|nr:SPOR domain-containing protein [Thalassomonas viridans]WDE05225.1 SPOR domain-containing protein [Thalassomonas viridans]
MPAPFQHLSFSKYRTVYFRPLAVLLGSSLLFSCATQPQAEGEEQEITKEAIHEQLNSHIDVWAPLAPEIERLLALESDMQLLVAELGKAANLGTGPLEQLAKQKESAEARAARKQAELAAQAENNTGPAAEEVAAKKKAVHPGCAAASTFSMSKNSHCKVQVGIHLAAFRTEANARLGWNYFKQKYGSVLLNKEPLLEAIVREEGTFQSLRVGPYSSATKAHQICKRLKQQNQYCAVIKYSGTPVS